MVDRSKDNRKLVAIVFTDVVGFTKLTAKDQSRASDLLDIQREILKPVVQSHDGQWVKEMGDGLILTFSTITKAVDCCIEIQKISKDIQDLNLRIGIHLGEVIEKENDIIGDDVNVASRVEPFSAPGGIAISNKVNDALIRESGYNTKYLGKPKLKGVGQEVKVYCIISHGLPETDLSTISAKLDSVVNKKYAYVYFFLLLVLSSILYFKYGRSEIVDQRSIAVLPFTNMSNDKENEYFSDGMTEEILNSLAQMNKLHVAARTSSFAYKGKNEDIRKIGKQLSVSHILEGSVRKFGEDIKVAAQLIRVSDGFQLWSDSYARKFIDIFKLQEDISSAIAEQLKIKLIGGDILERVGTTEDPEALDLYMQGRFLWNQNQEKPVLRSIEYFEEALLKDSNYALAESAIADAYYSLGIIKRWTISNDERSKIFQNAEDHARNALAIEPDLGEAYAVLGELFRGNQISRHWKVDKQLAETYFKKAIELSPKYTPAYVWYSYLLEHNSVDRNDEAEEIFKKALEIDPLSARVNIRGGELYNLSLKDYEKSLTFFDKAFELDPYLVYGSVNYEYTTLLEKLYHWDRAERSWEYAYQTDSTFFGTLWGMTDHYIQRGMLDKADRYLQKLTEQYLTEGIWSQGAYDIYFLKAVRDLANRDFNSMADVLEKMYAIDPCQRLFSMDYAFGMKTIKKNDEARKNLLKWQGECSSMRSSEKDDQNTVVNDDIDTFYNKVAIEILRNDFSVNDNLLKIVEELNTSKELELIYLSIFLNVLVNDQQLALTMLDAQIKEYEVPKYINIHPIFDDLSEDQEFSILKQKMGFN